MKKSSLSKRVFSVLGLILFLLVVYSLRPVPITSEEKCIVSEGKLDSVEEGTSYDIYLSLEGDEKRYYINRGIEQGLSVEDLKKQLLGKTVRLRYPIYWTLLDPFGKTKHIAKLEYQDQVLFSEIPITNN